MAYHSNGYKTQGKAQRGVCKYNDRELRFLCMKLQLVEKADCLFNLFNKTSHELHAVVEGQVNFFSRHKESYDEFLGGIGVGYSGCGDWNESNYTRVEYIHDSFIALCKRDLCSFEKLPKENERFVNLAFAYVSYYAFLLEWNYDTELPNGYGIDCAGSNVDVRDFLGGAFDCFPNLGREAKWECVCVFIDWCAARQLDKDVLLNSILSMWKEARKENSFIDWLNARKELHDWVYDYVSDKFLRGGRPSWMKVSDTDAKVILYKKKDAVITFFDMLSPVYKEIVFSKIKKSGAQQKYRVKSRLETAERKKMQLPISEEVKLKLKKLSACDDKCLFEVVEGLIEDAYEKRFGSR